MRRRTFFILFFAIVVVGTFIYAATSVKIPEYTFEQASNVDESVKKVIIPGKLVDKEVVPQGTTLTFYMTDAKGVESKVFYDGQEEVAAAKVADAAKGGRGVSVSGHVCGDRFHAKGITLH